MSLDDTKTVVTPEQVAVIYRIAGIGTRFAAMLADTFVQVLVVVGILLLLPPLESTAEMVFDQAPAWVVAALVLSAFLVIWGYFIFWETVWSGRTPGKRLAGIRVMRDGGFPIDFRAAFLRNICRYVDFLPAGYGFGAFVMFLSKDSKRLGDYVAGTVVVVDSPRVRRSAEETADQRVGYRLLGDPSLLDLRAVTRDQFAVVDQFLSRRETLLAEPRAELAQKIAVPLMELLGIEVASADYPYESLLEELGAALRARVQG